MDDDVTERLANGVYVSVYGILYALRNPGY